MAVFVLIMILASSQVKAQDAPDSLRLYFKALTYDGIDPLKGRDTMMAYCQQHPFALYGDGQWFRGMNWISAFTNDYWHIVLDTKPDEILNYWPSIFNWFIGIQHLNTDSLYQKRVLKSLAGSASNFDRNLGCNLWYNFILKFGEDTLSRNTAWSLINGMRKTQLDEGEDTTAYEILDFPLLPVASVTNTKGVASSGLGLILSPNPATGQSIARFTTLSSEPVELNLFDATGRHIRSFSTTSKSIGNQEIMLDLEGLSSGSYLLRLTHGDRTETRQLLIK